MRLSGAEEAAVISADCRGRIYTVVQALVTMACVCRSFLQFPHTPSKSGGEDGSFRQDGGALSLCPFAARSDEAYPRYFAVARFH